MNGNLRVMLACVALAAVVGAEAPAESGPYPAASGPYPPSGWRPSGRLLVLPARQQVSTVYGPPPQEYGPPSETYGPPATEAPTEAQPTEETTSEAPAEETTEAAEEASEQLREGGVYYVLTQDGRLQMVRYSTAPLKSQRQRQQQQQRAREQLSQIQAHQAQFQPKPAKVQQQASRARVHKQLNQQSQPFHFVEIQKSQEIEVAQPPPATAGGFVANLQYRNVEPISAPVFAFNSAPLSRILKK